jgi:hypothetical protein
VINRDDVLDVVVQEQDKERRRVAVDAPYAAAPVRLFAHPISSSG